MNPRLLAALFFGCASLAGVEPPDAALQWDATEKYVSFTEPAPATLTFTFVATDGPITVTKITPSCGCTTTDLDAYSLAAGQKGRLLARLDPRGKRGKQTTTIAVTTIPKHTYVLKIIGDYSALAPANSSTWSPSLASTPDLHADPKSVRDATTIPGITWGNRFIYWIHGDMSQKSLVVQFDPRIVQSVRVGHFEETRTICSGIMVENELDMVLEPREGHDAAWFQRIPLIISERDGTAFTANVYASHQ